MNRPCPCWIANPICFRDSPGECHENVLDAADRITGSRDATLSLDTRSKHRLIAEVISTLYPRAS